MSDDETRDFHHPFEPYDIQYELMKVIYECIDQSKIGILESPTGTGKSLSLICSSLTWLRDFQRKALDDEPPPGLLSDLPKWVVEHETIQKRQAAVESRSVWESRLKSIREQERSRGQETRSSERGLKRLKTASREAPTKFQDDEDFELGDYSSGEEDTKKHQSVGVTDSAGLSTASVQLMQELGLVHQPDPESVVSSDDEIKVLFCSRTHSQLSQFVQEVRKVHLPLPPVIEIGSGANEVVVSGVDIKHLPLGSRKNLCINQKVSRLGSAQAITEKCLDMQQPNTPKDRKCPFAPSRENETLIHQFRDHALAKVRDIEDLPQIGRQIGICPYYASRAAIKPSEVITLPYPLLLQKSAREALGLSLRNHVVIIDEAHNLMDAITNIHSFSITPNQMVRSKSQLNVYLQKFRNRLKGKNRIYIAQLLRLVDSIIACLQAKVEDERPTEGAVAIEELLKGKGVDQINLHKLVNYLQESKLGRKVEGYVTNVELKKSSTTPSGEPEQTRSILPVLSHVQTFIETLANPSPEGRFIFEKDERLGFSLKYMLLDPKHHFKAIVEEARAVILAGGTMSPMDDYLHHLFPYVASDRIKTFSCGHIIPNENLLVEIVERGLEGHEFDFTFEKRNSSFLTETLGDSIVQISRRVPDGVIIFFPSYSYLDQVVSSWTRGKTWSQLQASKEVFQEPRDKASTDGILQSYSEAIAKGRGGLMLSVIGGKLSEGINFSDRLGRAVIVVGLPFPNIRSAQWKAKLEYIEQDVSKRTGKAEDGRVAARSFTENACMRAVNQSIGRAIRHKNDYASILLLDKRYSSERILSKLPAWIRQSIHKPGRNNFQDVVANLHDFFKYRAEV